jgi:hypothetical protein
MQTFNRSVMYDRTWSFAVSPFGPIDVRFPSGTTASRPSASGPHRLYPSARIFRATTLKAPSGSGFCICAASPQGAVSHVSISASVVKTTGIALG